MTTFRLMPVERKIVDAAVRKSGMKLSEWIREALLEAAQRATIELGNPKLEAVRVELPLTRS